MSESREIHIVPHTHWDREWYAPFQVFRAQLVDLWDGLLALTELDPQFRFLMDGQTVVIDDYLAIRPEAGDRVDRAIRNGQIQVGPWYTLPDEFLVSGETLIRDLQRGIADGDAHGGAMRVGYLPDSFGHAAQMPQIYRQFGFRYAVVWRGVPSAIDRLAFDWEGPDGSRILTAYMGTSYSHGVDLPLDGNALAARLRTTVQALEPFKPGPVVLLMNGNDHVLPQPGLTTAVRSAGELLGWSVRLSRLDDYLERLPERGWPPWQGELRASSRANVLMGTLSVRAPDKQAYFAATRALERTAEPLSALSGFDAGGLLREAWTLILQNAAHDTACGSGIDAVAAEARQRSAVAHQIAGEVASRAAARLGAPAGPASQRAGQSLLVWNPSPFTRNELLEVILPSVPAGAQDLGRIEPTTAPATLDAERHRVLLPSGPVAGCGLACVSFVGGVAPPPDAAVRVGATSLQNDRVRCEVEADGTLRVHHLLSDTRYEGLGRLVDQGDAGDEYNFSPIGEAIRLQPIDRLAVRVLETGPLRGALELRTTYRIPTGLSPDRRVRRGALVDLPVRLRVALNSGRSRLDCEMELDHNAVDHRLRIEFPLPFATTHSDADGAYHVTRRRVREPMHEEGAPEWELPTFPMRSFVDASDGHRGIAVIAHGSHEYELIPTPSRLALTVLRAVGWLSRDDLRYRMGHAGPALETPGAQVAGRHRISFSIYFHPGDWELGGVWREAERALLPLEVLRMAEATAAAGSAGPSISVEPDAVQMTACVPRADGFDLRVLNASPGRVEARVTLSPVPRAVSWHTLGDDLRETLPLEGGAVRLRLKAWEIATVRVQRGLAA